jgi:hypothetical protein
MSTDLERELRDLFREKAGEAPVATPDGAAGAPQEVLRRGRLHQIGTVVGSAAIAFALVAGSVAALNSLLRGGDPVGSTGDYEVFERTATIEAFTVTSPSDWFLVNHWPRSLALGVGSGSEAVTCLDPSHGDVLECEGGETAYADVGTCTVDPAGVEVCEPNTPTADSGCPGDLPDQCQEALVNDPRSFGLPMFQLSNLDVGLDHVSCRDGLPDGAAVLSVGLADAPIPGITGPSFPPFPPGIGLPPEADGPCGPGRYAQFTLNGRIFFAWIGVGAAVNAEDRETVETAYETMSAIEDWEPGQPDHDTAAYVLAGGASDDGELWRLELRPGGQTPKLSLEGTDPATPGDPLSVTSSAPYYSGDLTDPIFGAITREATGVEYRPGTENTYYDLGGSPVPGTILPVPPSLDLFGFDLFLIDPPAGYAELGGHVLALGLEGSPSVAPPPVAEPRAESVKLAGSFEGQDWSARFTGAFTGPGSPCIEVTIEGRPPGHFCPDPIHSTLAGPSPYLNGSLSPELYLLVGSVPPGIVEIRFAGDDDAVVPQLFRCEMGPLGWTDPDRKVCAVALPSSGSGKLRYLDAEGDLLFEEGIGWGSARPELCCPVRPEQGGTYWAVYAWLGSGDQEAQIEEAQRYLEQRGVHGVRGSLFCDEGAAETLSTSAEHKVAVYFETEEEANTFALDAGLLGHEAGPVVAKVTIACLE